MFNIQNTPWLNVYNLVSIGNWGNRIAETGKNLPLITFQEQNLHVKFNQCLSFSQSIKKGLMVDNYKLCYEPNKHPKENLPLH
eukprot:Awhi_evm1s15313